MKKIMNMTTDIYDLTRYSSNSNLKTFYKSFGLDGLELMQVGYGNNSIIKANDVIGFHLKFFSCWMALWTNNKERLFSEFGNIETIEQIFGGTDKQALINTYKNNIDFAMSFSPEYIVFHVSDATIEESIRQKYYYSDSDIIDSVSELINNITCFIKGTPLLLFENLWYKGLDMRSPDITKRLLDNVNYKNKGVMLDIGHLLHTNSNLRSLREGVDYIFSVLSKYDDLSFIKGIHLHQTLEGEYVSTLKTKWQSISGDYNTRYSELMSHIYKIDAHKPFAHKKINEIIKMISPEYLVLEYISGNRECHSRMLREEIKFLDL